MQKFNKLKSIPAYLPIVNIDTDMIIPKQFLKTIKRTGLGKNLFFEMRYDDQGKEINDFVLNKDPFNQSKILIAGKNFGCGSSREHAVWALRDFGIRAVIASSFGDIFYNNCFKNGVLPIKLSKNQIEEIFQADFNEMFVSLDTRKIEFNNSHQYKFEVEDNLLERIVLGLDDVDMTLKYKEDIKLFEELRKKDKPWIYADE